MKTSIVFMIAGCFLHMTSAYRILGVIPYSGKSHYFSMQPLFQELALRGHDVTVISSFREKNSLPNYHQIVVKIQDIWSLQGDSFNFFDMESISFEDTMNFIWGSVSELTEQIFSTPAVKDFIKNDNSHFDLVISELFYQEAFLMFAHKYKAPMIGLSTLGFTQFIGANMGSPLLLPYMSHEYLNFGKKLSFTDKLRNMYSTVYDLWWRHHYLLPKHQEMAEKYFPDLPRPLPQIEDLERNISVVFLNTHFSTDVVRPYIPGIVEVGGWHVKATEKLPEDIQKFLDEAKDGAIYFSLGSNIKSSTMSKKNLEVFLEVFRKTKMRVLWKWEDDQLLGKPANVFIGKWLPQNDILAHPNIKVFITHGGLQSNLEALHHGVPLVGFPLFGDQFLNMGKVESLEYGIKLLFGSLTKEKLSNALNEVTNNPKYYKNARKYSERFKDRPQSPMDTAIFWAEYVMKHKGAEFMRSPARDMSFFELHMLDFGILFSLALTAVFIFTTIICYALFRFFSKGKKIDMNGKKNK